ncbi:anti-sigma factor antagonist [Streptomyces solicathayae]|uniref:Anti-sigma factor antagonist n=1 Tax=Streptomyces solicathayae TaxID=3081768 RepID=A0ABZ0LV64_9ACTN|nr:anti-sigma factor antagonist [Streptomyces sp. HUAS YS2]WOX23235.1 anti-sigma factor antagonist [Streptomyces sp. HUAS YS2]
MTIEWRYTIQPDLGVLSLAGYLGADAVGRFAGAVGWAVARGTGPVILDLTSLRGWSDGGRAAISEAAARLTAEGRSLELAAAPDDDCPPIPVHTDLPAALAAHRGGGAEQREWRSDEWPGTES